MAILNIHPPISGIVLDPAQLAQAISPDAMMHYAQNPVSRETSILYPLAAERYFTALGDLKNAAFSRRLRVENRIGIAFDVLFEFPDLFPREFHGCLNCRLAQQFRKQR